MRSAYPKDLNLIDETISGDHVQHVFSDSVNVISHLNFTAAIAS